MVEKELYSEKYLGGKHEIEQDNTIKKREMGSDGR